MSLEGGEVVQERLNEMEEVVGRLKRWVVILVVIMLPMLFVSVKVTYDWLRIENKKTFHETNRIQKKSNTFETVTAEKFRLVDSKGNSRGGWTIADGTATFGLMDSNGASQVLIYVDKQGPVIRLSDSNDKTRIKLKTTSKVSGLELFDETEILRVALGTTQSEGPSFVLGDTAANPRVVFSLEESDPVIGMYDAKKEQRLAFNVDDRGSGIRLLDDQGITRAGLGVINKSGPSLMFKDAEGHTKTYLTSGEDEKHIYAFGSEEEVLFSAP